MKVGLCADHAGVRLKDQIADHLRAKGVEVVDYTARPMDPDDDYPQAVLPLARSVVAGTVARGVFCCGSGIGPAVAANKITGVRSAVVTDEWSARDAVEHVDVNLLTLGERVIGVSLALAIVDAFLAAKTEGGRHERRRKQISDLEHQG